MRACPSQRAYEVCLCSVPGVVTADQGYNLPIYILLSVVVTMLHLKTLDGCNGASPDLVTCHTGTRHSVTPVERTRDPPSAVLAVRGPVRRTGMRYALCGNTPTWPCVRNNAARYRSTEILV